MTQANMASAVTTTTAAAASSSSLATAPGNQGNAVSMETVDGVMATDDSAIEDPAEKLVRQGATDMFVCVFVYVCLCICEYVCVCIHVCVCICVYVFVCMFVSPLHRHSSLTIIIHTHTHTYPNLLSNPD